MRGARGKGRTSLPLSTTVWRDASLYMSWSRRPGLSLRKARPKVRTSSLKAAEVSLLCFTRRSCVSCEPRSVVYTE